MDIYATLYELARLLLASTDDPDRTAEVLVRRIAELVGARRGFIVVLEGDGYEQRFGLDYDRDGVSAEERRFSRTVVRQAVATRALQCVPTGDGAGMASLARVAAGAVFAVPLVAGDVVFGVIYLELPDAAVAEDADLRRLLAEIADTAALFLRDALARDELARARRSLERDLFAQHDFGGIVTRDAAMLELLRVVGQVADSDATILVRGETGTGKELIARALHVNSGRVRKPFVALHCSALPATLLESEIFGHVRGAFTGADRDRAGRAAQAAGGTLFLDEIAEVPVEAQAKLLRFLQFGEIQRVGSDRVEKVDVRVIAATHRDLAALIAAGRFREDLYYRLKVIELAIPPLRERRGDLPLLVERFLVEKWRKPGKPPRFTAAAEALLAGYGFPGNVRELEHAVERACLLATGAEIGPGLLPPEIRAAAPVPARFQRYDAAELNAAREEGAAAAERDFLDGLMQRSGGNVSQAARDSGIHRSYLQRLLAKHRPPG